MCGLNQTEIIKKADAHEENYTNSNHSRKIVGNEMQLFWKKTVFYRTDHQSFAVVYVCFSQTMCKNRGEGVKYRFQRTTLPQ